MKYYLLTAGEYSDYHVVGLVATNAPDADELIAAAEKRASAEWNAWWKANNAEHARLSAKYNADKLYRLCNMYSWKDPRREPWHEATKKVRAEMEAWEQEHPKPWVDNGAEWFAAQVDGEVVPFKEVQAP